MKWDGELAFLRSFASSLEAMPELPLAPPDILDVYAGETTRLQDLITLVRSLPPDRRPEPAPWDDVLGPLWRRLFSRGDDITRYLLASEWRHVLLEAGQAERYLRTLTTLVAASRNFYLFGEALELAREGREAVGMRPSPALANLINTEGSVFYSLKDWDGAEARYREALTMAESLPGKGGWDFIALSRDDLVAQESFNLSEIRLEKGAAATPRGRARWVREARNILDGLDAMPLGGRFRRILAVPRAELAMLEGDFDGARRKVGSLLDGEDLEGPYRYPLLATHHRLMARVACHEGNTRGAYDWVRRALKIGVSHNYPMEEQLVLEEAFRVLQALHARHGDRAERYLVEDLVGLLEDKDWYTGRAHSRGVSTLAVRIGRALAGTGKAIVDLGLLETAGLVHDIGKLRIPWSLLNKIAPICPKERAILQGHSAHGEAILKSIGMEEVAEVVGQHHETMDGEGYPRAIVPDIHASVVGLCDVFRASVEANRRYKRPKTPDEAVREIRALSGVKFHPQAVEALLRISGSV